MDTVSTHATQSNTFSGSGRSESNAFSGSDKDDVPSGDELVPRAIALSVSFRRLGFRILSERPAIRLYDMKKMFVHEIISMFLQQAIPQ